MPILNLGQVMSLGTTLAGGRADFTLSEASAWANLGLEQISEAAGARHKPREGLAVSSTTSGGNRIAPPSDYAYPLAVTLYVGSSSTATQSRTTTAYPLKQRDGAWADAQQGGDLGGVPEAYIPFSTWFELWPSPNSAYSLQLRYGANQPTLVNSTDTPDLNQRWHQAWLYKTAELFHAARGDETGEAFAHMRYLNYVSMLETDQAANQHDRRSQTIRFGGARFTGSQAKLD